MKKLLNALKAGAIDLLFGGIAVAGILGYFYLFGQPDSLVGWMQATIGLGIMAALGIDFLSSGVVEAVRALNEKTDHDGLLKTPSLDNPTKEYVDGANKPKTVKRAAAKKRLASTNKRKKQPAKGKVVKKKLPTKKRKK